MDSETQRSGLLECGDGEFCPLYRMPQTQKEVKGAMISAVSGNLVNAEVIYETENRGLAQGWEHEISVVLESLYRIDQSRK